MTDGTFLVIQLHNGNLLVKVVNGNLLVKVVIDHRTKWKYCKFRTRKNFEGEIGIDCLKVGLTAPTPTRRD